MPWSRATSATRGPTTVPIELAGHGPGWPAAPDGAGSPGRAGGSVRPSRSWATGVAAAGPGGACRSSRLPGHGCSGGSSPAADPLAAAGHAGPSPRPVAERTPADHHRGRMMARGRDRGNSFLQRAEPVLASPPGGVSRVDRDHRQAGVGGHLGQPVPELPGRDARDHPPEAPPAPGRGRPATAVLAALLAGLSKVQVLDHDRPAAAQAGEPDQGADGGAEPPVALGGGQPGQHQRDGHRRPGRVPVRGQDPRGQVTVVQVGGKDRGPRNSSRDGAGAGAAVHDASRYQRPDAGSWLMS